MKSKITKLSALLVCVIMIFSLTGCVSDDVTTSLMLASQYKDGLIGDVKLYPDSETDGSLPCGINSIRFEFDRSSLIPSSGKVTVYNYDDDSVFEIIDASDTDNIFNYTNPDTNGAVIDFVLKTMLEPGGKYYVTADEGLFTVNGKEEITSPAYGGKDVWNIQMANYGIVKTEGESKDIGDVRTFSIKLGNNATNVKIISEGDHVLEFNKTEFTDDGDLVMKVVREGYELVTVQFLDKNGELVEKLENAVYVVTEPEESE